MNKEDNFFNKTEGKALIKFGAWILFIVILLVIGGVSNKNNKITPEEPEGYVFVTYEKMQKNLLDGNYYFTFRVQKDNNLYLFNGDNCENIISGYKESKDKIIKFYIKDNKIYKDVLGEYEELSDLYTEIDSNFLDINILFDNLKEYLYSVDKKEDKRTITYNKEGYQVIVKTNLNDIENIKITNETSTYDLTFKKTEKCVSKN